MATHDEIEGFKPLPSPPVEQMSDRWNSPPQLTEAMRNAAYRKYCEADKQGYFAFQNLIDCFRAAFEAGKDDPGEKSPEDFKLLREDYVTIPRPQHEALMAARVFVDRVANYDWSHYGDRSGLKEQQKEAVSVDAALRAAGFGASVYVCTKSACRDEHKTKCFGDGHQVLVLRAQYEALLAAAKSLAIFRPKHPAIAALRAAGIETESK